jgi:hypothetical protein
VLLDYQQFLVFLVFLDCQLFQQFLVNLDYQQFLECLPLLSPVLLEFLEKLWTILLIYLVQSHKKKLFEPQPLVQLLWLNLQ